jgi:hypothetical protein
MTRENSSTPHAVPEREPVKEARPSEPSSPQSGPPPRGDGLEVLRSSDC